MARSLYGWMRGDERRGTKIYGLTDVYEYVYVYVKFKGLFGLRARARACPFPALLTVFLLSVAACGSEAGDAGDQSSVAVSASATEAAVGEATRGLDSALVAEAFRVAGGL